MAATNLISLDDLGSDYRWARPLIESTLSVLSRPRYGFKVDVGNFYLARGGMPIGNIGISHSGIPLGHFHVYVSRSNVEIGISSLIKAFKAHKRGHGKQAKYLSKIGMLKRPGIRKWAVSAANILYRKYQTSVASDVMET